jgi:hypothetical protein
MGAVLTLQALDRALEKLLKDFSRGGGEAAVPRGYGCEGRVEGAELYSQASLAHSGARLLAAGGEGADRVDGGARGVMQPLPCVEARGEVDEANGGGAGGGSGGAEEAAGPRTDARLRGKVTPADTSEASASGWWRPASLHASSSKQFDLVALPPHPISRQAPAWHAHHAPLKLKMGSEVATGADEGSRQERCSCCSVEHETRDHAQESSTAGQGRIGPARGREAAGGVSLPKLVTGRCMSLSARAPCTHSR